MLSINDSRIQLRIGLKNQIITARNRLKAFREKKANDELTFEDVRIFSCDFERVSEWIKSSLHSLCDDISEKGALNNATLFADYEIEKDDVQIVQAEDVLKILSFYVDKLKRVQEIMREEIKI